MRNLSLWILVASATLFLTVAALAQRGRHDAGRARSIDAGSASEWVELGERWVDGPCDHDSIQIADSHRDPISRIELRVEQSDLELYDVVVTFADGTTFSPTTRLSFVEGARSRGIDLPGTARIVRRVDFRYGNRPGGGRARLVLFGR